MPQRIPASPRTTRRRFLASTAAVATGALVLPALAAEVKPATTSSTQPKKLRLGMIGLGGQGTWHLNIVKDIPTADIVALCDVDTRMLVAAARVATKAEVYVDFRDLLKHKNLDAVLVATPDHTHAAISAAAMRAGKHVYCEKPLTHTVREARAISELAQQTKLVTQMGIQIHAMDNYRRVVELVQGGAIGAVREVHVWNDRGNHPLDDAVVDPPATFNYDLWLGPVPPRPFKRGIHPYNWRRWWAYGSGLLGDIACHLMDVAFWALDLKHPTKISAEGSPQSDEYCADWVVARYEFPQRSADLPAVTLTWYDPPKQPPMLSSWKKAGLEEKLAGEGVMFVGERGMIFCNYTERRLLPADQFKEFKAPTTRIAHSIGHQREWIEACLANDPTAVGAPFAYGALLTETALLGVVAFRWGKELEWDAGMMTCPNAPEAERFLAYDYRAGWTL